MSAFEAVDSLSAGCSQRASGVIESNTCWLVREAFLFFPPAENKRIFAGWCVEASIDDPIRPLTLLSLHQNLVWVVVPPTIYLLDK